MKADVLEEQFLRIHNLYESMQKKHFSLNGDIPLTLGEIHLIEAIGKHPTANVTELAESMGNTKGAVSQMALKLEKKHLVVKTRKANNSKEIVLGLSEAGKRLFAEHQKFHADLYAELQQYPEALQQGKFLLDVIERYLNSYKKMLE